MLSPRRWEWSTNKRESCCLHTANGDGPIAPHLLPGEPSSNSSSQPLAYDESSNMQAGLHSLDMKNHSNYMDGIQETEWNQTSSRASLLSCPENRILRIEGHRVYNDMELGVGELEPGREVIRSSLTWMEMPSIHKGGSLVHCQREWKASGNYHFALSADISPPSLSLCLWQLLPFWWKGWSISLSHEEPTVLNTTKSLNIRWVAECFRFRFFMNMPSIHCKLEVATMDTRDPFVCTRCHKKGSR